MVDQLRRGIRLKERNYTRAPLEFELTPYEILMEDIRSRYMVAYFINIYFGIAIEHIIIIIYRNYELHKVMVDGDIPTRVKKDAHALILEFIRSRPPLKKVFSPFLLRQYLNSPFFVLKQVVANKNY